MTKRSIQVPCFQAAMTPSGTATTMARMMVRQRDRDRRLDAPADHRQHRHVRDQGDAEIALQQLADPGEELGVERLVQAERDADALELFGRRIVAGQDRGGIARRQPQQQKHEQRHHAHHGNGGQHAAKQISEHRCPSIMRQPLFGCRGFFCSRPYVSAKQIRCHQERCCVRPACTSAMEEVEHRTCRDKSLIRLQDLTPASPIAPPSGGRARRGCRLRYVRSAYARRRRAPRGRRGSGYPTRR